MMYTPESSQLESVHHNVQNVPRGSVSSMESISSVGLHCGRIGAMVVEVGAPEARALVARGAVSTNQLLGTQRTSKLTQSCLQNISKFSQFVSVSNAQLLGTQQTSK